MYKTVWLIRRNPSLTREQFIHDYETKHTKVVKDIPGVTKYVRRYPLQLSTLATVADRGAIDFDVVMEMWFESEEAHDAAFKYLAETPRPHVIEDEKHLFDFDAAGGWCTKMVFDIEHETDLSSPTFESTYEHA